MKVNKSLEVFGDWVNTLGACQESAALSAENLAFMLVGKSCRWRDWNIIFQQWVTDAGTNTNTQQLLAPLIKQLENKKLLRPHWTQGSWIHWRPWETIGDLTNDNPSSEILLIFLLTLGLIRMGWIFEWVTAGTHMKLINLQFLALRQRLILCPTKFRQSFTSHLSSFLSR